MIDLSGAELIGHGSGRSCYRHPSDPSLAVKVTRPGGDRRQQNRQEALYLRSLLARNVPFDHLPCFHGEAATSAGPGLVYELITDPDGTVSRTVAQAVTAGGAQLRDVEREAERLRAYLTRWCIGLGDTGPGNFLWQVRDGAARIVCIDGFGSRLLGWKATLHRRVPVLNRRKLASQWPGLRRNLGLASRSAPDPTP